MATIDPRELPEESLASLDQFGNRLFIYPAAVKGLWHRRRLIFHLILMVIFLGLPWLTINGHQALLLDVSRRQFAIFGLTFWAHDGPLIFFVLAGAVFSLALVTALFGRAWCGWACPQTVFIERVFRWIESLIEGNHMQRRKLNESDLSLSKAFKKMLKWALYTLAAWIIGNTFLTYFVGTDRWLEMIQHSPQENWTSFLVMAFVSGVTLFDFGWFREQFCIIMCPYGRFQSVLMDQHSLAVVYDEKRGEPRKGTLGATKETQGDCVNCFKCVAVCPTAIDIRRGLQMECIACTACIDACDEVMTKLNRPKGLIRYASEPSIGGGKTQWLRPRVLIYSLILLILTVGLVISLVQRESLNISLIRAIEAPYKEVKKNGVEPEIINHFKVALKNNEFEDLQVSVEVADPELQSQVKIVTATPSFLVKAGGNHRGHIFVEFPSSLTKGQGSVAVRLNLKVRGPKHSYDHSESIQLLGPKGSSDR